MGNALWLEYQELFNLNLTWRADLSCPETTGPDIFNPEVSFVLPLELVLKEYNIPGNGCTDKSLYQTASLSYRRKMALVRAQGPKRHTPRLDLGLCILITKYHAGEDELELYLGVTDKGCFLFLSFLGSRSIVYSFLEYDFFQFFVKIVIIQRCV